MPASKHTNRPRARLGGTTRATHQREGGGSKGSQSIGPKGSLLQSAAQGQKHAATIGKQGHTTLKKVADAAAQATITSPTDYTPKGGNSRPKSSLAAVSYAETASTTSLSSAAYSAAASIMSKSASQSTYSHGGSSRSPSLTRDQGGAKTGTDKSAP